MRIFLVDGDSEMISAWNWAFADVSDIHILNNPPHEVDLMDAIAYPIDTFGIDAKYNERWLGTRDAVRKSIHDNFYGELPVGQATIVNIPDKYKKKYLIAASVAPDESRSAYFAFRAVLRIIKSWNEKHSKLWDVVVFTNPLPGVFSYQTALQMRVAYEALHGRGPIYNIQKQEDADELQKMLTTCHKPFPLSNLNFK